MNQVPVGQPSGTARQKRWFIPDDQPTARAWGSFLEMAARGHREPPWGGGSANVGRQR